MSYKKGEEPFCITRTAPLFARMKKKEGRTTNVARRIDNHSAPIGSSLNDGIEMEIDIVLQDVKDFVMTTKRLQRYLQSVPN